MKRVDTTNEALIGVSGRRSEEHTFQQRREQSGIWVGYRLVNQAPNNTKAGMCGEHDVPSTYRNARSKSVRDASGSDFKCSCSSNPLHEFWIPAPSGCLGSLYFKYSLSAMAAKKHKTSSPKPTKGLADLPILATPIQLLLSFPNYTPLQMNHFFCRETKPEREQGIVVGIANVHRELINRLEPSASELTCEPVVTKQEISDALAFSSRKPSRDNCIYLVNIGLHHNRAARDDDHHASDSATHIVDNAGPGLSYRKIRAVTKHLCIGKLPDNNDGIIEVVGTHKLRVGIFLVDNLCRRINRSFHSR
nr:rplT [Ipomoea batatas]